jgi:hypothetical protein
MEKRCVKCSVPKPHDGFPKSARYNDGYNARCKSCVNEDNRLYREANKNKVQEARKRYYDENNAKLRHLKVEYSKKRIPQKAEYDKQYRNANAERVKAGKRNWEQANKDNVELRLKRNLRRRLNNVLRGRPKAESTMNLLGCDASFLKSHLASQFTDKMNWDNYGQYGWHVDHIRPCYSFDLTNEDEQKICFHYSNLRPLWWLENISRPRNHE